MNRRNFLGQAGLAAAALAAAPAAFAQAAKRPNVVVILADDLGYADLGFQGCKDIPTPNLDALAAAGVKCTNGYVSHPFCSPTRAGLMTGRYQQRFGHENNPKYDPADTVAGLPVDQVFLAKLLKEAGYATGAVGKWHLGAAPCFHPNVRGFSEYVGFIGGGHRYLPVQRDNTVEYAVPIDRNGKAEDHPEYMTDFLSDEAAAFIRRHAREPFCLYLAYNAVHTPLEAPAKYLDRFPGIADPKRRTYAAMTSAMDDGIGRVLAALREEKLDGNTLVFFLSDNGGPITVVPCSNAPLRAGKGAVYEGGIRVPFVARWTGVLPAGGTCSQPVISLDLLVTALAAAGVEPPAGLALDGLNILPLLKGDTKQSPHEHLFWRSGGGERYAVRKDTWKLVGAEGQPDELYDLATDIGEAKNLATEKPDKVSELRKAWDAWNAQLVEPKFQSPQPARKKAAAQNAKKAAGAAPKAK